MQSKIKVKLVNIMDKAKTNNNHLFVWNGIKYEKIGISKKKTLFIK